MKEIKKKTTPFAKSHQIHGVLRSFYPIQGSFDSPLRNIPCMISLNQKSKISLPECDTDYLIEGDLQPLNSVLYSFNLIRGYHWESIPQTQSWVGLRDRWHKKVKQFVIDRSSESDAAHFLCALLLGNFEHSLLKQDLGRFGLLHILAISGFHFSLMGLLIHSLCRLVMSPKQAAFAVSVLLTGYLLFLGGSSSVLRAWMMALLFYIGIVFEKQARALNSLGVALLLSIVWDPLLCLSLGFQFSYLITACILLFFPIAHRFSSFLIPKRCFEEVLAMNRWDQHAYLVLNHFREGLALSLAVNAGAVPLTLFYFNKFPLMSILYNFFFPLGISVAIPIFLFSLCLDVCHFPFSGYILGFALRFTEGLLALVQNVPISFDFSFTIHALSLYPLVMYLFTAFVLALIWHGRALQKHVVGLEFNYL